MAMRAEDIYERYIKSLPREEQQRLSELLKIRLSLPADISKRAWQEIAGKAPYPLLGEDAQDWISRSRREDDRHGLPDTKESE